MKILYFSTVNWNWIKQRPHFIAEGLADRNIEVEYISLTPILKQNIKKHKIKGKLLKINDKYVLPFASKNKYVQMLNKHYIERVLNQKYDVIILTHPFQYNYISKALKYSPKIIYDCMDNMPYFYNEKLKQEVIEEEKKLCEKANAIITSSNYLKERIIREYGISISKVTVIKNAVDQSFISSATEKVELEHPNMIYIGTIGKWFDYETINKFAASNPEYTIYLIGPVDNECRNKVNSLNANIKLLGAIEHKKIKSYIIAGDIMLIPFKNNELIRGVDPVKMYEYLALNKPVISSYWNELSIYKQNSLVYFYNTVQEFKEQEKITSKATETITNKLSENKKFIYQNNWNIRIDEYVKVIFKYNNKV